MKAIAATHKICNDQEVIKNAGQRKPDVHETTKWFDSSMIPCPDSQLKLWAEHSNKQFS